MGSVYTVNTANFVVGFGSRWTLSQERLSKYLDLLEVIHGMCEGVGLGFRSDCADAQAYLGLF